MISRLFTCFCIASCALAKPLTDDDRSALLDEIEAIRNNEDSGLNQNFRAVVAQLQKAVSSDGAAVLLYEKCVEAYDFKRRHRKPADFREWKKTNKKRLSDEGFARALRHQCLWLLLTAEAARYTPEKRSEKLSAKATEAMKSLADDAQDLGPHRKMLSSDVQQSIFAKALGIDRLPVNREGARVKWPMHPVPMGDVFETVIQPEHRKTEELETLEASWLLRLKLERRFAEGMIFGEDGPDEDKPDVRFDDFVTLEQPRLIWAMQSDLFGAGDQQRAALALLEHLREHQGHPDAERWLGELETMITVKPDLN